MNNWDDYRFILALDRASSIRGAAKLLGVNHATVSRRLASINMRSSHNIFDHMAGGGYRVTKFGSTLVAAAQDIEDITLSMDRYRRASETTLSGTVRLSVPRVVAQYLLRDELAEFGRKYPNIELGVEATDRFADLDQSEADVIIRGTDHPPDHLVGRRLFPYALSYYCQTNYLDKTPPAARSWIGRSGETDLTKLISRSPFPDAPIGLRVDDVTARHQMAIAGHGLYIGACYMADPEPCLMRLPEAGIVMRSNLWVLTHPDLAKTPRIKSLMQYLTEALLAKKALITGESVEGK